MNRSVAVFAVGDNPDDKEKNTRPFL